MVDSAPEILSYFTNRIKAAKEQQLKELDLSVPYGTHPNDKLQHIPDEVFELTQLENLNLSGNDIWSDYKYQGMHNELLQLMIKFKLCYEISDHQNNFIAPQLLSLNQPDYNWSNNNNLQLRYIYEFMPKGILTRFIVEMHKNIYQNLVWRSGVVLANDYAQAEIIEYYDKKEIRIKINGNNKRDLMTIVVNEIDKINDFYERIKYNKLIPCNCAHCANNLQPHFYRLRELKERVAYKQEYIGCGKPPFHQVQVLELIDDTIGRQNLDKKQKSISRENIPPNISISDAQTVVFHTGTGEVNMDREQPDENRPSSPRISPAERTIALAMALAVLITFIFLVLNPRAMDGGTLAIVRFLAATFAGISGYLFAGNLGLEAKIPLNKTQIKAGGAFAAFVLVLFIFFVGVPESSNSSGESSQFNSPEYERSL